MEHLGYIQKLINPDLTTLPQLGSADDKAEILEMSAEEYHLNTRRMSSSGIRQLLQSPRHYLEWFRGAQSNEKEADHFRFGRAAHLMILEPQLFRERYVLEPKFIGLTKDGRPSEQSAEAREMKKKWYAELPREAVVIDEKEMTDLVGMIESLKDHDVAKNILTDGKAEATIHWTDPDTLVQCRARTDFLVNQNGNHVIELKTTRDVRGKFFAHDVLNHGYHIQTAFYYDGVARATGIAPQSITIIAVEKEPPYACAVWVMPDAWYEKGQEIYKDMLELYALCLKKNEWPAYQTNAGLLMPPTKIDYYEKPSYNFRT